MGNWCKMCLIPAQGIGLVWCDNRGPRPELVRRRYQAIDALLASAGAGSRVWRRHSGNGRHPSMRHVIGDYRRLSGLPIVVKADDDRLTVNQKTRSVPLRPFHGPVFVASGDEPPGGPLPWAPHAGSERLSIRFVFTGEDQASHLLFNGIAYRRDDFTL